MRKFRYHLVTLALTVMLSGFSILASGPLASAVASHHSSTVTAASVVGKSVRFFKGYCPGNGSLDC